MRNSEQDERSGLALYSPVGPEYRPEWSQRLVMDVALGTSTASILEVHNLQHHQFEQISMMPTFVMAVGDMRKNLEKEGATFKLKAGIQADLYLVEAHKMIVDPDMDPRVRTRLIEDMARWAGFDTPAPVGGTGGGRGFEINIQFGVGGNRSQGITIDGEALNGG